MKSITKFRGQRVDTKEWVYGTYTEVPGQLYLIFVPSADGHHESHEVIPTTVDQWSGHYDKNHTEIYNGDLVRVSKESYRAFLAAGENGDKEMEQSQPIYLIEWNDETLAYMARRINEPYYTRGIFATIAIMNDKELEVVGNIHEKLPYALIFSPEALTDAVELTGSEVQVTDVQSGSPVFSPETIQKMQEK